MFVENGYVGLGAVPRVVAQQKRHPHAAFAMFSECDWPFSLLPGLYCSLSKPLPWAPSWAFLLDDGSADGDAVHVDLPSPFSFVGRATTHPIRRRIVELDALATPCLDLSSPPLRFNWWEYGAGYRRLLRDSLLVLCPRGVGASTIRVLETMRAGRVPVSVSDAWQPPQIGDSTSYSTRIAEKDVSRIPAICAQHRESAAAMGRAARVRFEEWFPFQRLPGPGRAGGLCTRAVSCRTPRPTRVAQSLSVREFRSLGRSAIRWLAPRRTAARA